MFCKFLVRYCYEKEEADDNGNSSYYPQSEKKIHTFQQQNGAKTGPCIIILCYIMKNTAYSKCGTGGGGADKIMNMKAFPHDELEKVLV